MYSCVVVSTMFIINLLRRNKYLFIYLSKRPLFGCELFYYSLVVNRNSFCFIAAFYSINYAKQTFI